MTTPHDCYREALAATGDPAAALKAVRDRYRLDLVRAKEVALQARGVAASLDEHQGRWARALTAGPGDDPPA